MTQPLNRPTRSSPQIHQKQSLGSNQSVQQKPESVEQSDEVTNITSEIQTTIKKLESGLHQYQVRTLVEQARKFGIHLKKHELKTNHLRRFLDAVKQIEARLNRGDEFSIVDNDIAFLQPQLAYAAARKREEMKKKDKVNPAKEFSDVITVAIKEKVKSPKDFERLVQLVEAIIAYHKEAGGE
ncbi:type III-A CRISPR-associated protein Csm2 [Leptolyngbya sp. 'hensonii']|uniref:type III-A CRISPR-associated protein Csm2 n=1 Tax=Leptolyngbya sp. 'hensonii' TaxID=1922337 RepID=UPI00094FF758|nr:type III-A CRISPR-associated protein Csm2 [Leptolyngbya sp. 'hensonii']OLP19175.1 type III-A CRISPR-associated protein Csm2 [Leptolyngbya sp. 'hensonii']